MQGANAYNGDAMLSPDSDRAEGQPGDLLLRVASLIGEIEALKRERHTQELRSTRVEFASVYFRKRRGAGAESKATRV